MLHITFITDYVCPYCLVAREALHQAMEETGIDARITTLPFELTKEPSPRVDTCHDEKRKARWRVLEEPCRELGLPMKLPPMICPRPYTRLAFEGWLYACDQGRGDDWSERMYRAYFLEEKDIGDMAVLAAEANALGLDAAALTEALSEGRYTQPLRDLEERVREMYHPEHVPTLIVNGTEVPLHHYTREEMVTLLRRAAEGRAKGVVLSLQGGMAVGKTTAAMAVRRLAPHIHVCLEDTGDVVAQVKARGLDKRCFRDYVEIQRLWLANEVRRWREAQAYPLSLMDYGAEEIIFYTLHYPQSIGMDWDVATALRDSLREAEACMPRRILFLDAPEDVLRRRKEADLTRDRGFFEHSLTRLLPLKRPWLLARDDVDVLDTAGLTPEETARAVIAWAERWGREEAQAMPDKTDTILCKEDNHHA